MSKLKVIDEIIANRLDGDTCVETAENYVDDVKDLDPELHAAMVKLNEAASEMTGRLQELNDEYNLGYEDI